jgi:hypothetical protein
VGILAFPLYRWFENISPHPRSYAPNYWKHSVGAAGHRVLDEFGYGQYRVAGVVRIDGTLAARRVTLLRHRDLSILAQTWSDPDTGEYAFEHIANDNYLVVCDDYVQTYNAAVADWVVPEPILE